MSGPSEGRSKAHAGAPCPICAKPAAARFAPFCSGRCADLDLGRWLKGGYAIPGPPEEAQTEGEGHGQAPENEEE